MIIDIMGIYTNLQPMIVLTDSLTCSAMVGLSWISEKCAGTRNDADVMQ